MPKKRKSASSTHTHHAHEHEHHVQHHEHHESHPQHHIEHHESSPEHREVHSHDIEHAILKNMVELQKVHVDLAEKFDGLAKEIQKLLALFEVTARNFAKNAPLGEYEKDKDFLEKIDRLLDQNKLLAKGLSIMEERLRERMYGPQNPAPPQRAMPDETFQPSLVSRGNRPLPKF